MGARKVLCIIGGIIALVSTLFFSFYKVGLSTGYGIAIFFNFMTLITSGNILTIVFTIVYTLGVVSGIFILIGIKVRVLAIIGAIFALFLGIILLLTTGLQIFLGPDISFSLSFLVADPIIEGILPFDLLIGLNVMSLGTVLLVGGGVLGLIGGIMGTS